MFVVKDKQWCKATSILSDNNNNLVELPTSWTEQQAPCSLFLKRTSIRPLSECFSPVHRFGIFTIFVLNSKLTGARVHANLTNKVCRFCWMYGSGEEFQHVASMDVWFVGEFGVVIENIVQPFDHSPYRPIWTHFYRLCSVILVLATTQLIMSYTRYTFKVLKLDYVLYTSSAGSD